MPQAQRRAARDDGPVEDHFVHLRGVSWSDYERVMRIRGEGSVPRLAYEKGVLELMSPSTDHERMKATIGAFVVAWCDVHEVDFTGVGSWTLKSKKKRGGLDPDDCYIFGENKKRRPDLAIEVVWTSGGIDKRNVYRRFAVPELWFWQRGRITVHVLRARGYDEVARSQVLPGIDLTELASYLDRFPTSRALRTYRAALTAKRTTK
jgi:Uma2 family endonuclease